MVAILKVISPAYLGHAHRVITNTHCVYFVISLNKTGMLEKNFKIY